MPRLIKRDISKYVSTFRKRLIKDFAPRGTFKRRVDKTLRIIGFYRVSDSAGHEHADSFSSVSEGAGRVTPCVRNRKMIGSSSTRPENAPPPVWFAGISGNGGISVMGSEIFNSHLIVKQHMSNLPSNLDNTQGNCTFLLTSLGLPSNY